MKRFFSPQNILIVSLIVGYCIIFVKLKLIYSSNNHLERKIETCIVENDNKSEILNIIAGNKYIESLLDGKRLVSITPAKLSSIFNDSIQEVLFISFGDESCEACVNHLLEDIKTLGNSLDHKKIVVLTAYESNSKTKAVFYRLNKQFKVIDLHLDGTITDSLYLFASPNFFISNKSLKANSFFIYNLKNKELNENYYKSIIQRLSKRHNP